MNISKEEGIIMVTSNDLNLIKKRIGSNIRVLRKSQKISQSILCEQINKNQPTLSRYESGQTAITIDTLYDICQYFEIPLEVMISKDLSLEPFVLLKEMKNSFVQEYKHYFEDKNLNLYYLSTSQDDLIIESDFVTAELEPGNYIPFLFEVKHNIPEKQLYEGNLVIGAHHAYFYFKNRSRSERGMIITYIYPQKNKNSPITLLGLMISISHGSEQRPCSQKCFITSQKIEPETLKPFLKMDNTNMSFINEKYIDFLTQASDREIYDWICDN